LKIAEKLFGKEEAELAKIHADEYYFASADLKIIESDYGKCLAQK